MNKPILLTIVVGCILIVAAVVVKASLVHYDNLQSVDIEAKVAWSNPDVDCPNADGTQNIHLRADVSYPANLPFNQRYSYCSFALDNELFIGEHYGSHSGVPSLGQYLNSEVYAGVANIRQDHKIRVCCYGQWQDKRAYDACVLETLNALCPNME